MPLIACWSAREQVREARQAAEAACLCAAEAHTRARSAESAACHSASHHDRSLRYLADELDSLNGLLAILYAAADSAREGDVGSGEGGRAEIGGSGDAGWNAAGQSQGRVETGDGAVGGARDGARVSSIDMEPTIGGPTLGGARDGARVSSIDVEKTIGGLTSIERMKEEAGGLAVAVADALGRENTAATLTTADVNVDAAEDEADDDDADDDEADGDDADDDEADGDEADGDDAEDEADGDDADDDEADGDDERDEDEAAAAAVDPVSPGRFGAQTPMMTPYGVLAARDGAFAAAEGGETPGPTVAVEATPQWLRQAASALFGAVEATSFFGARPTPSAAAATRATISSPTNAPVAAATSAAASTTSAAASTTSATTAAAATSSAASTSLLGSPPVPTQPPSLHAYAHHSAPSLVPAQPPTPSQQPLVLSPESPAAEEARPPWALHLTPTMAPLPYVQLEGLPFAEALALLASTAATPKKHHAPEAASVGEVLGGGRVPSGVPHPVSETSPLPDGLALPWALPAFQSASLLRPSRRPNGYVPTSARPNGYVPTSARTRLSWRRREPFKAELRYAQRRLLKMIQGDSASLRRQIDQLKAPD